MMYCCKNVGCLDIDLYDVVTRLTQTLCDNDASPPIFIVLQDGLGFRRVRHSMGRVLYGQLRSCQRDNIYASYRDGCMGTPQDNAYGTGGGSSGSNALAG